MEHKVFLIPRVNQYNFSGMILECPCEVPLTRLYHFMVVWEILLCA